MKSYYKWPAVTSSLFSYYFSPECPSFQVEAIGTFSCKALFIIVTCLGSYQELGAVTSKGGKVSGTFAPSLFNVVWIGWCPCDSQFTGRGVSMLSIGGRLFPAGASLNWVQARHMISPVVVALATCPAYQLDGGDWCQIRCIVVIGIRPSVHEVIHLYGCI